jgi:hypothetical protein
MSTGYASEQYARSLSEWGMPVELKKSGGWLLRRPLPDGTGHDFMGPYPFFCCADWDGLADDLKEIEKDGVAVSLVTDPFADATPDSLKMLFPDRCYVFKKHYVADLSLDPALVVSKHHQRYVRRALRNITITKCDAPLAYLAEWCCLYGELVERHRIKGLLQFSPGAFAALLSSPSLQLFRAEMDGKTIGLISWMVQNNVAYYHLSAYSSEGYQACASYGFMWHAWEAFAPRLRWLCFGGTAGTVERSDGLGFFKEGWSSGTRDVYFCGRVFDSEKYSWLSTGLQHRRYFPAYRSSEFEQVSNAT